MSKKRKRSALEILRERERQRRLVPAVVIRRRKTLNRINDDPGVGILSKADRYAAKHANKLHDLVIRSMGLLNSPDAVKRKFERDGLEAIQMDSQAKVLINNAVRKINEILIFKMVANELVNDPETRDRLVELFINQRFDAMIAPRSQQIPVGDKGKAQPASSPSSREELLMAALSAAMDLN